MPAKRRTLIALAVSLAFLALVFWSVSLGDFLEELRKANYLWLIPATVVYFLAFTLRAWRWQSLLAPLGGVTLSRSYWVATIGYAANNVLPLRLGEFARAYLLRRNPGLDMTAGLATVAVERILDGLTLLLWLGIGLLYYYYAAEWSVPTQLAVAAVVSAVIFLSAGVCVMLSVIFPAAAMRAARIATRPLPSRYAVPALGIVESMLCGFAALRQTRKLPYYFLVSNAVWAGEALVYFLVARALDVETHLIVLCVAVAASNLATAVPSTSGGIGPFEFFAKMTLVVAGIAEEAAAAYAVVIHATLWVPVTIAGAVLLFLEGAPLKEVVGASGLMTGRETQRAEAVE